MSSYLAASTSESPCPAIVRDPGADTGIAPAAMHEEAVGQALLGIQPEDLKIVRTDHEGGPRCDPLPRPAGSNL